MSANQSEGIKHPTQVAYQDPLSGTTRKERRNLMVCAGLSVAMLATRAIPSKITALGIDFTTTDQVALFTVLAVLNSYLVTTFVIYAIADLRAWEWEYKTRVKTLEKEISEQIAELFAKDPGQSPAGKEAAEAFVKRESRRDWEDVRILRSPDEWLRAKVRGHSSTPLASLRWHSVAKWRFLVDFALPVLLGAYSVAWLWQSR
jgi:hypothetical protein